MAIRTSNSLLCCAIAWMAPRGPVVSPLPKNAACTASTPMNAYTTPRAAYPKRASGSTQGRPAARAACSALRVVLPIVSLAVAMMCRFSKSGATPSLHPPRPPQPFQVGQDLPPGQRVGLLRHVVVDGGEHLFRGAQAAAPGVQDLLFPPEAVVDVLAQLGRRVLDRRAVGREEDPRPQGGEPGEGAEVVLHVP